MAHELAKNKLGLVTETSDKRQIKPHDRHRHIHPAACAGHLVTHAAVIVTPGVAPGMTRGMVPRIGVPMFAVIAGRLGSVVAARIRGHAQIEMMMGRSVAADLGEL
jgi:hypothetical protein